MASLRLGQCLRGRNRIYVIGKQLQETVWLASNQPVIVKSLFQPPFIRPLIDEIVEPSDSPTIVLKYLDDNLLNTSLFKRLTEALNVLHDNNFVHTDVKPDNILVSYGQGDVRFTDVQLADCGNTVPADSAYAKDGDLIGAPIWRSPEAQLRIGWGTQTDIWSFGALLITLLSADNFFLFNPDVPADHDKYELKILQRQCQFFGPFPLTYREICPQETKKKPFSRISEQEMSEEDKEFILKIMKLDPRDRPSAAKLLQDEWFFGEST
ncbi:kinase-like domain-containing protein [Aspergillus sergii]|uniref:Kinase-like domain-containing protein n=1 Tax=Aspergillus sergii TaxID=1034303 RepID=A0A5N6XHF5_9EURO|nr:kinase-like domain-containing protein [Aspergillus sergii]